MKRLCYSGGVESGDSGRRGEPAGPENASLRGRRFGGLYDRAVLVHSLGVRKYTTAPDHIPTCSHKSQPAETCAHTFEPVSRAATR